MFEPARVASCALLALVGGSAAAQVSDVARYRRRADSLAGEWRAAVASVAQADSVARAHAALGRDTVRAGALLLLLDPALPTDRVHSAAARAWALFDSAYGRVAQDLSRQAFLVDAGTPRVWDGARGELALAPDASADEMARALASRIPQLHPFRADRALTQWLGGTLTPSVAAGIASPDLYVRLVTAPSRATRACFLGDLGACRSALNLDLAGDAFLAWYDRAERREVVQTFRFYLDRPPHRDLFAACTSAQRDTACIELLRTVPPGVVPQPLPPAARIALVRLALRLGGRDAYGQLVASPHDPLPHRLATAAGMGVDSLIARWRESVIAARPRPVATPLGGVALALAWAGFFAACGLRSSRWRRD